MERIRKVDVPADLNRKMVSQIFLTEAGEVPVSRDRLDRAADLAAQDKWLSYSTATRGPEALTVTYKTNAARTQIYAYDGTKNPAIQTASGAPIYGDGDREVLGLQADGHHRGVPEADEALSRALSWRRRRSTPSRTTVTSAVTTTGVTPRPGSTSRNAATKIYNACNDDLAQQKWELGSGDIPGAWSQGKIKDTKKADFYGHLPDTRRIRPVSMVEPGTCSRCPRVISMLGSGPSRGARSRHRNHSGTSRTRPRLHHRNRSDSPGIRPVNRRSRPSWCP